MPSPQLAEQPEKSRVHEVEHRAPAGFAKPASVQSAPPRSAPSHSSSPSMAPLPQLVPATVDVTVDAVLTVLVDVLVEVELLAPPAELVEPLSVDELPPPSPPEPAADPSAKIPSMSVLHPDKPATRKRDRVKRWTERMPERLSTASTRCHGLGRPGSPSFRLLPLAVHSASAVR
jgi:hypothetical protein